jgi:hypothetical protein
VESLPALTLRQAGDDEDRMIYQLTWKILPGLRGLSCSDFHASATNAPDNDHGVAVECANDADRDTLLKELEAHFASQRFSNNASAFESVKSYVLERATRTGDQTKHDSQITNHHSHEA